MSLRLSWKRLHLQSRQGCCQSPKSVISITAVNHQKCIPCRLPVFCPVQPAAKLTALFSLLTPCLVEPKLISTFAFLRSSAHVALQLKGETFARVLLLLHRVLYNSDLAIMASTERLDQPAEVASKVLRRAQVSKVASLKSRSL